MELKKTVQGICKWLEEAEIPWLLLFREADKYWPPNARGMNYERRSRFALFPNQNYYDLPRHTQPFQARAKIELHEAKRAGTHLDFRIVLPDSLWSKERVYDFAVVKRTTFPGRGERPALVVQRNNHSLDYFNTDSHVFGPGEYGEGRMQTIWRGNIDVMYVDQTKIEFQINDGEFAGRYCLFTSKSEVTPDTRDQGWLIRMKDPVLAHKERMKFVSSAAKIDAAHANPDRYLAEIKADGANFMIVPGPKENTVVSRRLSVSGHPINQASKMPWIKYIKFPPQYHGRTLHVEIVEYDPKDVLMNHGHHTETAGLLNSKAERSRAIQLKTGKPLIAMVWDIDGPGPYSERRAEYLQLVRQMKGAVDMRRWGDQRDRLFTRRYFKPRIFQAAVDNRQLGITMQELFEFTQVFDGEGVVLKPVDGLYYGEPYIKNKGSDEFDVKVVGFQEGTNKYQGSLGALIVEDPETLVRSKVGTGFTDQERQDIWDNQEMFLGSTVSVEVHELSPKGALRGPRFIEFHPDNVEELNV